MILLDEFFHLLANSEMATRAVGNSLQESIKPEAYPKVVNAVNLGLIRVCRELIVRKNKLKLHQQTGILRYYFKSEYAAALEDIGGEYYLEEDLDDPFQEDVLRPLTATDSNGNTVYIDDEDHPYDFFTYRQEAIEIAAPCDGGREALDIFEITYQAKHPKIIVTENFNPAMTELDIPDVAIEPLILVTANYLIRKPTKLAKGEIHPGAGLMAEFNNAIRSLKQDGFYSPVTESTATRYQRKGFP
jgi:hypothetical protein